MKNDIQNATKQNVKVVKNTLDEQAQPCDKMADDDCALKKYWFEKRRALITELKGLDNLLKIKTEIVTTK